MGTWFWYHLKAKNALSLNMAISSTAYFGIFFYSPKKENNGEKNSSFSRFLCFVGQ